MDGPVLVVGIYRYHTYTGLLLFDSILGIKRRPIISVHTILGCISGDVVKNT